MDTECISNLHPCKIFLFTFSLEIKIKSLSDCFSDFSFYY
jgi:hypothetical protein